MEQSSWDMRTPHYKQKHKQSISNAVLKRSVAKSKRRWNRTIPTTSIPLHSQHIAERSEAVECLRLRKCTVKKLLLTLVMHRLINRQLWKSLHEIRKRKKYTRKHKHMVGNVVCEGSAAKSNKIWKHWFPITLILLHSQRVAECSNAVEY